MSKPVIPLLTAFLALWLFGGAYWLSNLQSNNISTKEQIIGNKLMIKDGDFKAESSTIFAFQIADADIIINEEQLSVLETLAAYLDESSQKQLRLIAYYGKDEYYDGKFENLGIARAETVKYILTRNGAPESSIDVEGRKFEKLALNENGLLSGGIEFDIFDKESSNAITEAPFLKEKIFFFKKNKYVLSDSVELENFAAGLKQYMVDKKDAEVIITGFHDTSESKSMGSLRAKFIKDILIKHGINIDRISLDSKIEKDKEGKKVEIKVL
jgi:outer membrane protein OmpA-like peptidoglycan-associated protein